MENVKPERMDFFSWNENSRNVNRKQEGTNTNYDAINDYHFAKDIDFCLIGCNE